MGCASSTQPLITTAGSEMLKAATNAVSDATKTAEGAVQGVKDTLGKNLIAVKENADNVMQDVKHEVDQTVREKAEMLEEAKNSLLSKLHLGQQTDAIADNSNDNGNCNGVSDASTLDVAKIGETEILNVTEKMNTTTSVQSAINRRSENVLMRNDSEADSLRTSTPEPEIEQALANVSVDDDNVSPPTPKPHFAELEKLTEESNQQQQRQQQQQLANVLTDSMPTTTTATDSIIIKEANNSEKEHVLAEQVTLLSDKTNKNTNNSSTEQLIIRKQRALGQGQGLERHRPATTEWERNADLLATLRKFNSHIANKHGNNLTRLPHSQCNGRRDGYHNENNDACDNLCNCLGSPLNIQSSSNMMHERRTVSSDKEYSNGFANLTTGRKFDYNYNRQRFSVSLQTAVVAIS
uniref:Uncharacterized protein n=1 Tax=Glossina palpalis gambiensis TaxID=67801 RepID=A0A1B0B6L1_9MUSC